LRAAIVLAGLLALAGVVHQVALLARVGRERLDLGFRLAPGGGGWAVARVDAQACGLQPGDRVVSLDGNARAGAVGLAWAYRSLADGREHRLAVERAGTRLTVPLAGRRLPRSGTDYTYLLVVCCVSLSFLLAALFIGFRRGDEALPLLGTLALFLPVFTLLRTATGPMFPLLDEGELFRTFLLPAPHPFHLAVAFAFYRRFPTGTGPLRWLERALLPVTALLWITAEVQSRIQWRVAPFAADGWIPAWRRLETLQVLDLPATLIGFGAICGVAAYNYRAVTQPDHRRRMRWVVWGSLLGIGPFLLYFVLLALSGVLGLSEATLSAAYRIANLALAIVPIVTAHAVVRHRLFDIDVVVRRGMQYLLARQVLRVALAVPATLLVLALFRYRDQPLGRVLLEHRIHLLLLLLTALTLVFRRHLRGWLDRRFFREAYDRERVLVDLAAQIAKLPSLAEISSRVNAELESALHPKALHVVEVGDDSSASLVFSSGDSSGSFPVPRTSRLAAALDGRTEPVDVPLPAELEVPEEEQSRLVRHGIVLVVPMTGTDGRLGGLLLLGEKRSEEPYGAADRKLLAAVAAQMAIVRENSSLRERFAVERQRAREVLSRVSPEHAFLKECPRCGACADADGVRCAEDGTELVVPLPVPRVLAERYRLDRLIGRGGMGAVYEGSDLRLLRRVAVKVVAGTRLLHARTARRFEIEARSAARLSHPNVVSVFDYGTLGDDVAFLVMERVEGVTLRAELDRRGAVAPRLAADWAAQVLEGLASAHAAGIVHRDLKPENILLARDGEGRVTLKVLDFGLAKSTILDLGGPESLTVPGTVVGTFGYMSPEQLSGEDVDARSDVFSFGVVLVEVLTGERPFRGWSVRELVSSTLCDEVRLPGRGPEVEALDQVVRRCLSKDRGERYGSARELLKDLVPALRACPPLPVSGKLSPSAPTARL